MYFLATSAVVSKAATLESSVAGRHALRQCLSINYTTAHTDTDHKYSLVAKKDTTLVYLIPYLFSFWSQSPIDLLEPQNRLLLLGELHLELARARSQC